MLRILVCEVVFNHAGVIELFADFHDCVLVVMKEFGIAVGPRVATAALACIVIDIALILDLDVCAVPGNFALDILNEEAVGLLAQPILLDTREVARIINHRVQVLQLIGLQAEIRFIFLCLNASYEQCTHYDEVQLKFVESHIF